MDKIRTLVLAILLVFIFLIGCNAKKEPLRMATYTYADNNRIDNLKPMAQYIEQQMGWPVQIKSYPDVATFIEGIKSDEVDIALINTLGYLLLSLENDHMLPVATLKVMENATDNYKTVVLSSNKNISALNDIKSKPNNYSMLLVSEGSTSGNLVPRLLLSSMGISAPESQFKKVGYGGNHTSTFHKLLDGESDICAIGSDEYFKQIEADSTLLDVVKVLWMSEEIPLGPLLLNNKLSERDREEITSLILNLHKEDREALESLKAGWSEARQAEKFYAISDSYYDNFRMVNGNNTDLPQILRLFTK